MNPKINTNWHVAILASGTGSNALKIIEHLSSTYNMQFSIFTNKPQAGVIKHANRLGVKVSIFDRSYFKAKDGLCKELRDQSVDLVVLAGFLWLMPNHFVAAFQNRMVNIHPSLLPKYGGKGMYGSRVHEEVRKNNDLYSGITIHYVNEKYDDGNIILQASTSLNTADTAIDIAKKVQKLEHRYFPEVVEDLLLDLEVKVD